MSSYSWTLKRKRRLEVRNKRRVDDERIIVYFFTSTSLPAFPPSSSCVFLFCPLSFPYLKITASAYIYSLPLPLTRTFPSSSKHSYLPPLLPPKYLSLCIYPFLSILCVSFRIIIIILILLSFAVFIYLFFHFLFTVGEQID